MLASLRIGSSSLKEITFTSSGLTILIREEVSNRLTIKMETNKTASQTGTVHRH